MQVSHSRVECFNSCPYKFKLHYVDDIKTIPNDDPSNALYLGTALHTGLEKDVEEAIHEYFMNYPIITDAHINEAIKLETMIQKAKKLCPEGQNELLIDDSDFKGFMDLLVPARTEQKLGGEYQVIPNVYDLYDFKYSNNVNHYKESPQLHLYKYFFEKNNPGKVIRKMYFLIVPKVNIKQSKTEDLFQFRQRIYEELDKVEPELVPIEYDPEKVINFLLSTKKMLEEKEFPKNKSYLCNYCEYIDYCQKGNDLMNLPSTERRLVGKTTKRKLWIYGAAFSGKTTMIDDAPNPLNLNTDGNIQFVTMPYMAIKDEVTVAGRMTNRKFAWDVFKETIAELEKGQNDFKTIVVDLLEDTYESCRLYMYDKLGITHESDDSFRAWDKVRTEFLSTIRRLINLDYENIVLISHEDSSKDITKKSGDKITAIKPNINEKVANKIAGMVDIVARVVVEDDGSRNLEFKSNEVVFGGGRLKGITRTSVPLSWEALMDVYAEVNDAKTSQNAQESTSRRKVSNPAPEEEKTQESANNEEEMALAEETKHVEEVKEEVKEEAPATRTRTRKRRTEE